MELAIWSQYYYEMTPENAVKEFIKNGIYAAELSDEHGRELLERGDDILATGRAFAEFIRENSFTMTQGHLWLSIKICADPNAVDELFRWIDLYEAIGIKNMVLHCDGSAYGELGFEACAAQNIEMLKVIAEYIKDKDITVCLENLRSFVVGIDRILYLIARVGSDKLGICLDTGHLNLQKDRDQRKFILGAGKRLHALHIADNEGERDQHIMPFTRGNVNFVNVVRALKEIGYEGLFNLEIPGESHIPLELRNEKIKYVKSCYDYLMNCE
jgi:sugar phosphate isomerase/epimerase